MIQAVLFDLDETLVDRTETMRRFLLDQHQRFTSLHCYSANEYADVCLRYQHNGYADKFSAFVSVCSDMEVSDNRLADRLFGDFKNHYGKNPVLFPGVINVLEILSRSYRLGLVTNGRTRGQTAKIEASGIAKFFSSVCISEAMGSRKPSQEIFLACLAELSVLPAEAVFVGDNPQLDIEPAKSLGMHAVWLKSDYFSKPAVCDALIKSIDELPFVLKQLP